MDDLLFEWPPQTQISRLSPVMLLQVLLGSQEYQMCIILKVQLQEF